MTQASLCSRPPVRIGISSCLLGEKVRFDGNHKLDRYLTETLGAYFEYVPVCPEVAIGLGVPRAPIRLVGEPGRPRAVGVRDPGLDVTAALAGYGRRMGRELTDISGYILKSKSPSCGLEGVKVYGPGGSIRRGRGLYARALLAAQPLLPVEEEGRLADPARRENFIERVYAYRRWQELAASRLTPAKLVEFHTIHELALLAHGSEHYRALGRLVAGAGRGELAAKAQTYAEGFMRALRHRATRRRHANVLGRLMGYLQRRLDAADRAELVEAIEGYRLGRLPLAVPLTLLRHHFRCHPDPYVLRQVYLNPHPQELMLRDLL